MGDAVCSFNPIYGQGMSVAALEALTLRRHLARGSEPQPRRWFRDLARVVDVPWQMAAGGDLIFPGVQGRRTRKLRLMSAYIARLHAAAADDARLATAFIRVAGLVSPPQSLLRPGIASRVLPGRPHPAARDGRLPHTERPGVVNGANRRKINEPKEATCHSSRSSTSRKSSPTTNAAGSSERSRHDRVLHRRGDPTAHLGRPRRGTKRQLGHRWQCARASRRSRLARSWNRGGADRVVRAIGRLDGKTVLDHGRGPRHGRGPSRHAAAEGAAVIVADVNDDAGQRVAAAVGGTYHHLDVTAPDQWRRAPRADRRGERAARRPGQQRRGLHRGWACSMATKQGSAKSPT